MAGATTYEDKKDLLNDLLTHSPFSPLSMPVCSPLSLSLSLSLPLLLRTYEMKSPSVGNPAFKDSVCKRNLSSPSGIEANSRMLGIGEKNAIRSKIETAVDLMSIFVEC